MVTISYHVHSSTELTSLRQFYANTSSTLSIFSETLRCVSGDIKSCPVVPACICDSADCVECQSQSPQFIWFSNFPRVGFRITWGAQRGETRGIELFCMRHLLKSSCHRAAQGLSFNDMKSYVWALLLCTVVLWLFELEPNSAGIPTEVLKHMFQSMRCPSSFIFCHL